MATLSSADATPCRLAAGTTKSLLTSAEGSPGSDCRLVKVDYPAGKVQRFSFATEAIRVYEGNITLKAIVRFSTPAHGSRLKFKLDYQACNERACMAPASAQTEAAIKR